MSNTARGGPPGRANATAIQPARHQGLARQTPLAQTGGMTAWKLPRRRFIRAVALGAALLLTTAIHVGLLASTLDQALSDARARVRENIAPKAPGVAVALSHDGKLIWSEGFGYADLEAKIPVTPKTLFRIGSISKPLTAAGLMLLVEQGRIDLDADIHQYVPDYPDKGERITTRELAGHLAGIRHYRGNEVYLNRQFASVRDGLVIFQNDPLLFPPGTKFSYSSYGWNLISRIMEIGANQDFLAYMQASVFKPLELQNTVPDYADRELPVRTRFYEAKPGGGFAPAPPVNNSYKWAGGGFLSTPEDLVHFASALLRPGFLQRESLAALFTSQKTADGKLTGYGIGWYVHRDPRGHRLVMHSGGSIGGTSVLILDLNTRTALAMAANCTASPFNKTNLDAITAEFCDLFSTP